MHHTCVIVICSNEVPWVINGPALETPYFTICLNILMRNLTSLVQWSCPRETFQKEIPVHVYSKKLEKISCTTGPNVLICTILQGTRKEHVSDTGPLGVL